MLFNFPKMVAVLFRHKIFYVTISLIIALFVAGNISQYQKFRKADDFSNTSEASFSKNETEKEGSGGDLNYILQAIFFVLCLFILIYFYLFTNFTILRSRFYFSSRSPPCFS